jgi:hypothetical protein
MAGLGSDTTKTPDADYTEQYDIDRVGSFSFTMHVQTRIATLTSDTCTSTDWSPSKSMALLAAVWEQSNSWNYYAQRHGA